MKKFGRTPDGGGWRADPEQSSRNHKKGRKRVGFDYVHAVVDRHTRLAYVEIHAGE